MKIDYSKLLPGDILCTSSTLKKIAGAIRFVTGGWKHLFDPLFATHIVCVASYPGGLFYGIDMVWPKIRKVDIHTFLHDPRNPFTDHICCVLRSPEIACSILNQMVANDFLITAHAIGVKYDLVQLLEFLGLPEDSDNPKDLICSELAKNMLQKCNVQTPTIWDYRVSPRDLQVWDKLEKVDCLI